MFRPLVFAGLLGALAGCADSDSGSDSTTLTTSETDGAGWLYVQNARSGSVSAADGSGRRLLTLEGVSPFTLYFTDRPDRFTGQVATWHLVDGWGSGPDSFAAVPPNAALEIIGGSGNTDSFVFELAAPAYDLESASLIYEVIEVPPAPGLPGGLVRQADAPPAEGLRFGHASLFIDNGVGPAPASSYKFSLEVGGVRIGAFSEATVPDPSADETEYREGADADSGAPPGQGPVRFGVLTLERGMTASADLYNWFQLVQSLGSNAVGAKKDVTLILANEAGEDEVSWNIFAAYPDKYETAGLDETGDAVLIETLEFEVESIQRVH